MTDRTGTDEMDLLATSSIDLSPAGEGAGSGGPDVTSSGGYDGRGGDPSEVDGAAASIMQPVGAGFDGQASTSPSLSDVGNAVLSQFQAGPGGDVFDLYAIVPALAALGYTGGNPFGSGHLALRQAGGDVELVATDPEQGSPVVLATFRDTRVADFDDENFDPAVPLDGRALAGVTLQGTDARDTLDGGLGDDELRGGAGDDDLHGLAGSNLMFGDEGQDQIDGGLGRDTVYGGDGDDRIDGGAGDDWLFGGAGDDIIDDMYNTSNSVSVSGGTGRDRIDVWSWDGIATVAGDDGDDTIALRARASYAYFRNYDPGTGGVSETISSADSFATVTGGAGNDVIRVEMILSDIDIDAGDGDDVVALTGEGAATVTLGAGRDRIVARADIFARTDATVSIEEGTTITDFQTGAGGDVVLVDALLSDLALDFGWTGGNPFATGHLSLVQEGGDTVLYALERADPALKRVEVLTFAGIQADEIVDANFTPALPVDGGAFRTWSLAGTADADTLVGGLGGDTIRGGEGDDRIDGGRGDDGLRGEAGADVVFGGIGDDTLFGGSGTDDLRGGAGDDTVFGGADDDVLTSFEAGDDGLYGGAGRDRIYASTDGGRVVVDGGDGSDDIEVALAARYVYDGYDDLDGSAVYSHDGGRGTVSGGRGDDRIDVTLRQGSLDLDAGDGDDVVGITGEGTADVTLGRGADRIVLQDLRMEGPARTVTDFTPGTDVIDLDPFGGAFRAADHDGTVSLVEAGVLALSQDGDDTVVSTVISGVVQEHLRLTGVNAGLLRDADFRFEGGDALPGLVNAPPSGAVTITGRDIEDAILRAEVGIADRDGIGPITLRWLRDGAVIAGAAGQSYRLTQADVGARISVDLRYTDGRGTDESIVSRRTDPVANRDDAPDGEIVLRGDARVGATLTIVDRVSDEDGIGARSYRWMRDGTAIAGATGSAYTLTEADGGARVGVALRYTDGFGTRTRVDSVVTRPVVVPRPAGTESDDALSGDARDDVIDGGAGDDVLRGNLGQDRLFGGTGADRLVGGADADVLYGGADDDVLTGGANGDRLFGGDGRDVLDGSDGNDRLVGGGGADRLRGSAGADTLYGSAGNDRLSGGGGDDVRLDGGAGDDIIAGGGGSDRLIGGTGSDRLVGHIGADRLFGGDGDDVLSGGADTDILRGGAGNDTLAGDGGDDRLRGGAGNDAISGGAGSDRLIGNAGDDRLAGGAGRDVMTGGSGRDVFVFEDLDTGRRRAERDVVTDFRAADTLDLRPIDADTEAAGDQSFGWSDDGPAANSVWITRSGRDSVVLGDRTGDGRADFAIELDNAGRVTADDFIL